MESNKKHESTNAKLNKFGAHITIPGKTAFFDVKHQSSITPISLPRAWLKAVRQHSDKAHERLIPGVVAGLQ